MRCFYWYDMVKYSSSTLSPVSCRKSSTRRWKPCGGSSRPTSCECLASVCRAGPVSENRRVSHLTFFVISIIMCFYDLVSGTSPRFLIIMEYCEKGSLRDVLDSDWAALSWPTRARMCRDAARGLYRSVFCHHCGGASST